MVTDKIMKLRQQLDDMKEQLPVLLKDAEKRIVRREVYTDEHYHFRPYLIERDRANPAKPLSKTRLLGRSCQYCFDKDGTLVVMKEYQNHGLTGRTLYEVSDDKIVTYLWNNREIVNTQLVTYRSGMVESYCGVSDSAAFTEEYHYSNNRLDKIVETQYDSKIKKRWQAVIACTYDDLGQLKEIRVLEPKSGHVIYNALDKAATPKVVLENVRLGLLKEIPGIVSRSVIDDEAYCVLLAYSDEDESFMPPFVGVGISSQRQQWRAEYKKTKEAYQMIWNPAEFKYYGGSGKLEIVDPQLLEQCRLFNKIMPNPYKDGKKVLLEIASELNNLDWSSLQKVTDDFVVIPVDLEVHDLQSNAKKCLPKAKLNKLKKQSWI